LTEPTVSVVLAVDTYSTGARTVEAVREQTIAERLELVLTGPSIRIPPGATGEIAAVRTVDVPFEPLSSARAAGIAAARGRVVYVAETHGFPRPDCLQRLVDAIEDGAAAAMPRIVNANPGTMRSWASLFATYGGFTGSVPRRLQAVALHNGAFDRTVLQRVAKRPADLIYGVGLTEALRAASLEMRFVPAAVVDHLNVVSPKGILADRLVGGRLWASMRAMRWPASRRAVHALGTPLAPVVMLGRILRSDGWREHRGILPRGTAAVLAAYAALQALGELAGYVGGPGSAEHRHVDLELHREAFL
jgi:hypothetical protein